MIKTIDVNIGVKLDDYDLYATLSPGLRALQSEACVLVPKLKGKKVWMINSTAQGGGVAEMMPRLISLFRQIGIDTDWIVTESDKKEFFNITKKLHNLIHGVCCDFVYEEERALYEQVNKENAEALLKLLKPHDIVVIHDPQPAGMIKFLKGQLPLKFIWRCHIGIDEHTEQTKNAWDFLHPYTELYNFNVFSATAYIPGHLTGRASVMHPTIDPLDHKNRYLSIHKTVGILSNSGLARPYQAVLTPPFGNMVKRLHPDGIFSRPFTPSDPGLLYKPFALQVGRWDRLKGFMELIKGFELIKTNGAYHFNHRHSKRLEMLKLVLAGPDPTYVSDDPEGEEVLDELIDYYKSLSPALQRDIVILNLPMESRKQNHLIVNALQLCASVVVQNSIREGFGLTVTEAMWKKKPVIGGYTCGINEQIMDDIQGKIIKNPRDPEDVAYVLNTLLKEPKKREVLGHRAQKTVIDHFLIFKQILQWIHLFDKF
ncbi:glycosyltransferase [Sporocytophaga myxococcoides]|uniref:glycosyltransferase n=1 Tax=Sporocytophaga myxococcoides TaxID=153721 RepID=UPI000411033E|nr:glycosyltransferase [Sporocytophaga myxococcoides]